MNSIKFPEGTESIRLEEDFYNYIEGKSVAIGGTSPSVKTMRLGSKIDEYDIIARIHCPYRGHADDLSRHTVHPDDYRYVGSRTDIFYCGGFGTKHKEWLDSVVQTFKDSGGKFLCWERATMSFRKETLDNIFRVLSIMPLRLTTLTQYIGTIHDLGFEPLLGTHAILDILRCNPSRVFIYGCPSFVSATHPNGMGVAVTDQWPKRDFNFLRNLWRNNDNIEVDPVMTKLFEITPEEIGPPDVPWSDDFDFENILEVK